MAAPAVSSRPAGDAEVSAPSPPASSHEVPATDPHERDALSDLQQFMKPCCHFIRSRCLQGDRCSYEHIAGERAADAASSRADMARQWRGAGSAQTASAQRSGQVWPGGRSPQSSTLDKFASLSIGGSKSGGSNSSSSSSNSGYFSDKLRDADARALLEVGVLPFRQSDSCTFQLLFGEEINAEGTAQLCLISGPPTDRSGGFSFRRSATERFAWQGAMNLLGGHAMARLGSEDGQRPVAWLPSARSAVYLLELCGEMELSMQQRFNSILGRPVATSANEEPWRQYSRLHWVELKELLDCIHSNDRTAPLAKADGVPVPLIATSMHALRQPPLLNQLGLMQRDAERTAVLALLEAAPATGVAESIATVSAASPAEKQQSQHISRHCYVAPSLRPADDARCIDVGVIAFRRNGDTVELLFCNSATPRPGARFELTDLCLVGDRTRRNETLAQTAAIAVFQTDGGKLSMQCGLKDASELQQQLQLRPVLWDPAARSAIFFHQLPAAAEREDPVGEWVELSTLLRFLDKGHQRRRTVLQRCTESTQTTLGKAATMASPTVCILRRPPVLDALDQLLRDCSSGGARTFKDLCAGRAARARILTVLNISQHSYVADQLKPTEAVGFRAAGALIFRRTVQGDVQVLMGRQNKDMDRGAGCLNLLGGRVEAGETAAETAAREVWEESGKLLDKQSLLERTQPSRVIWFPPAKYALHFVELRGDECDICERYAANRAEWVAAGGLNEPVELSQRRDKQKNPNGVFWEMEELHWIDLPVLLRFLDGDPRGLRTTGGDLFPVVGFVVRMLQERCAREMLQQLQPNLEFTPRVAHPTADCQSRSSCSATRTQPPHMYTPHRPFVSHAPARFSAFSRHEFEDSPKQRRRP